MLENKNGKYFLFKYIAFITITDRSLKVGITNAFIKKIYFVNELNKSCMFCMLFKIKTNKFAMLLHPLSFNETVTCESHWQGI